MCLEVYLENRLQESGLESWDNDEELNWAIADYFSCYEPTGRDICYLHKLHYKLTDFCTDNCFTIAEELADKDNDCEEQVDRIIRWVGYTNKSIPVDLLMNICNDYRAEIRNIIFSQNPIDKY